MDSAWLYLLALDDKDLFLDMIRLGPDYRNVALVALGGNSHIPNSGLGTIRGQKGMVR